jgi:hypothetical protein
MGRHIAPAGHQLMEIVVPLVGDRRTGKVAHHIVMLAHHMLTSVDPLVKVRHTATMERQKAGVVVPLKAHLAETWVVCLLSLVVGVVGEVHLLAWAFPMEVEKSHNLVAQEERRVYFSEDSQDSLKELHTRKRK